MLPPRGAFPILLLILRALLCPEAGRWRCLGPRPCGRLAVALRALGVPRRRVVLFAPVVILRDRCLLRGLLCLGAGPRRRYPGLAEHLWKEPALKQIGQRVGRQHHHLEVVVLPACTDSILALAQVSVTIVRCSFRAKRTIALANAAVVPRLGKGWALKK